MYVLKFAKSKNKNGVDKILRDKLYNCSVKNVVLWLFL